MMSDFQWDMSGVMVKMVIIFKTFRLFFGGLATRTKGTNKIVQKVGVNFVADSWKGDKV